MGLPIRFHWNPGAGNELGAGALAVACRRAEEFGIESVLLTVGPTTDCLLPQLTAIASDSQDIKFMVECEGDPIDAASLAGWVHALMEQLPGRILLSIHCNKPWTAHNNQRESAGVNASFGRTAELLATVRVICKPRPELFLAGCSAEAAALAIKFGDCLWRSPKSVARVHSDALPILHMGKEVGLQLSLIGRETTEEACAAASVLFPASRRENLGGSGPWLWTEAACEGGPGGGIALVGSFEALAATLMRYREKGISQFLLNEPVDGCELIYFGEGVLPLVRRRERGLSN